MATKKKTWKKVVFYVSDLCIELTRRCNMACAHCLRGEQQNLDISFKAINQIANHVKCNTVVFTGGEPSLNIKGIDYYFKRAEAIGNIPDGFYVVTNGVDSKRMSNLALSLLNAYGLICRYNGEPDEYFCGVTVSQDRFHEVFRSPSSMHDWDVLKGLAFYRYGDKSHSIDGNDDWLISSGRAESNGIGKYPKKGNEELDYWIDDMEIREGILEIYLNDILYVSSNGLITSNCDMSYDDIDKSNFGNLDEFIKKCEDYYFNGYGAKIFGR